MYTMARSLITQSNYYIPTLEVNSIQETRKNIDLYLNPYIDQILRTLEYNDGTLYHIDQKNMSVWYPLENRPDQIHEANQKLKDSGFNIVEVDLNDITVDSATVLED